jgi:hypothetical protein
MGLRSGIATPFRKDRGHSGMCTQGNRASLGSL